MRSGLLLAALTLAACAATPAAPPPEPPNDTELEIAVREVPPATVLAFPLTGPYAEAEKHFEEFARDLQTSGIAPTGDLTGVYFDDPSSVAPDRTRYEIRIPVSSESKASEPYRVYEAEGFRAAAVTLTGSYADISRHYGAIYAWIEESGLVADGPLIEVYLMHAGSGVPPAGYVTKVLVPVRPRGE